MLSGHHEEVAGLAWSPDATYLASGGCDNRVIIWGKEKHPHFELASPVQGLAWIGSNLLAVGECGPTGNLSLISTRSEATQGSAATGASISGVAYSDRWGILVSHRRESFEWELWNTDLKKVASYSGHRNDILNMAVTKDGSLTATIATDETLQVWDMRDRKAATPPSARSVHKSMPAELTLR
jgi:COMPASS component SWD3